MNNKKAMTGGGIALFAMICVMAVSMRWLDIPIARYFLHSSAVVTNLAVPLGTVELVAGNAILVGAVSLILIIRGSLPEHAKALLLACVASLVAFVFNFVLKVLFGRFTPDQFFLAPGSPIFHFFQGNENSSFPSGHMMMATAFSTVIVRLYAHTLPLFLAVLIVGGGLLLVGEWHFLSDVIAGVFLGATIGLVCGETWSRRLRRRRIMS